MKLSRPAAVLVTAGVLVTTVLGRPGAADPAVAHGSLGIKGPGTNYSVAVGNAPAIAIEPVAKGATAVFELRVTNSGSVASAYAIGLVPRQDVPGAAPEMVATAPLVYSTGFLSAKVLPTGPYGFVTPSIAAGKAVVFQVKVPMPANAPAGHAWIDATLRTPDGTVQGAAQIVAEQKATGVGTTAYDLVVTGPQGTVGSSAYRAAISTSALINKQSGSFTLKFTNNGPTTQGIGIEAVYVPYCLQFKIGTQFSPSDPTHPWLGPGRAVTNYLKPGASQTYQVTLSRPTANCLNGPAIFNTVEIRASAAILGQDPIVSAQTYHSVLLVAPYGS